MALNRNPTANTAKAYDLSKVHPSIHPTGPAIPVTDITFETYVPRRSQGKDANGQKVYWCLSCDRRVANHNQPFCLTRHRKERAKEQRRRRAEAAKPIRISAEVLSGLHERREKFSTAMTRFKFAQTDARAVRFQDLEEEFELFQEFLRSNFSK